jgi:hypothetical protein
VLGGGDDVGKSRASAVRVDLFDQICDEARDIVAPLADLDSQDAVGELEANIVVAAQGVRRRPTMIESVGSRRGAGRRAQIPA